MIAPAQLYSINLNGENFIVMTVDRIDDQYWFVSMVYDMEQTSKKPVLKNDIPLNVRSLCAEKWNIFPVHSEMLNSFIASVRPGCRLDPDEMLMTFPLPETEDQRMFILKELDRAHKVVDASLQLEMSKLFGKEIGDERKQSERSAHYSDRTAGGVSHVPCGGVDPDLPAVEAGFGAPGR